MVLIMTNHFSGEQAATSELLNPAASVSECPRCGSRNTKFCYYNNYNKSQPRHFCKSCKRHWTKGGTLRNIPAGRRRRNKRPRASTTPEPPHKHSRSSLDHDHKDMSDILYQALIRSSSPPQIMSTILESNGTTSAFTAAAAPQIQNYSNIEELAISSFTSAPTSAETFDSPEESTSAAPAQLWNWNEVDFLASLWDHSDAEPYNYKPIFEGYYPR